MSAEQPLVSVIVPTYNRRELVCRAVNSVLTQTWDNLECIVIDDCSTDGTLDALTSIMAEDARLRVVSHLENRHVSSARNTGLKAASGDLIAFLDDDDVWLPDKLGKQVECLARSSADVGMVYCWLDIYQGDQVIDTRRPSLSGWLFDELVTSQPLGNASTLLVKREVIDCIGGFDENLVRGNDGDFIRRTALHYRIDVVPEVLVHYFVEHDGHERITGYDYDSLMNGIRGHEAKLKKFEKELRERPASHAELLAVIAMQYALVGDLRKVCVYLCRGFKVCPMTPALYMAVPRVIVNFLFKRARY